MNRLWTFLFLLACLLAGIGAALMIPRGKPPREPAPTGFQIKKGAGWPEIRGITVTGLPDDVKDDEQISQWGVDCIAVDAPFNEAAPEPQDLAGPVCRAHIYNIKVCMIVRVATKEDAETWAKAAQDAGVDMLALRPAAGPDVEQEETFWRPVLEGVRKQFHGKLVYVSTPDDYWTLSWWDAVDYVGVAGPFGLSTVPQPTDYQLQAGINSHIGSIQEYAQQRKKKAIFFDVSYPPTGDAASHPVTATYPAATQPAAELAPLQKRCYQAALVGSRGQPGLAGLFVGAEPDALRCRELGETIGEQWKAATTMPASMPATQK